MIFKSIRKLYLNFTQIACNKACKRERHFYILIILFIMWHIYIYMKTTLIDTADLFWFIKTSFKQIKTV